MSIYYLAGKNSDQPIVDVKDYIFDTVSKYDINQLLNVVKAPVTQEYYSLNYAEVYYKGSSYSDSTTLSISSPSISEGSQATCYASFGLSLYSLNISGSSNESGDVYYIYPSNNSIDINNFAVIQVVSTDNGQVKTYEVIESGSNFTNTSSIVCYKVPQNIVDGYNASIDAMQIVSNISLINDKFCISKIIITDEGSGYARYDDSRKTIEYKIITNNHGSGDGFYGILKSKNYAALNFASKIKTKIIDRSRPYHTDKYGKTITLASSASLEKILFDKILYNATKTQVSQNQAYQAYQAYSFDKEKQKWTSLETIYDQSSSSEDKCSTFNNGFTYATLGLAASFSLDNLAEPNCQIFDRNLSNRGILTQSIRKSMDRVINTKKIYDIYSSIFGSIFKGEYIDPTTFFDPRIIRSIGATIANDITKVLRAAKLDYNSFGFCSLKEMDDFVIRSIAAELNSERMRIRFSASFLELIRKTMKRGQSLFGEFSYPLTTYNLETVRREIERRLYRFGGSWQKIVNIVSTEIGWQLGYSNGSGNVFLDPFDDPSKIRPIKPKPKTGLLKALLDKLKGLKKSGILKAKCVNGKTVIKGTGKAVKILAVYVLLQELAQAQDGWDVSDAVGEFVSPLPTSWFDTSEDIKFIDLTKLPQQDIDTLQNQIIEAITRYVINGNPENFNAELRFIIEYYVPKTTNDFDEPISEQELNQVLQNIIDDADSIRDQLGDDAASLEDLNTVIEDLKRQISFWEAANKNMEQAFMDAFGSSDICECPGNFEQKQKEFNEKAQQILDEYNEYHENMRQNGPMTEEEWEKMEKRFFGGSKFSTFENGLPSISLIRMPLDENDNPILPDPKDPTNEKGFHGLDMYQIQ